VLAKVDEECTELKGALGEGRASAVEEEFGDLLPWSSFGTMTPSLACGRLPPSATRRLDARRGRRLHGCHRHDGNINVTASRILKRRPQLDEQKTSGFFTQISVPILAKVPKTFARVTFSTSIMHKTAGRWVPRASQFRHNFVPTGG